MSNWLFARLSSAPRQLAVREKILNDPYYRLQSWAEVALAARLGMKIDVNRAQVDDWLRLPGISIHQARSLVELGAMGVQFLCIEDLAAALSVPNEQIERLKPVLHFRYYDPESASAPQQVNVNTAPVEQLAQIPILSQALAAAIVQNRCSNGFFRNLADLGQRLSLDSATTAQLMYYLRF